MSGITHIHTGGSCSTDKGPAVRLHNGHDSFQCVHGLGGVVRMGVEQAMNVQRVYRSAVLLSWEFT